MNRRELETLLLTLESTPELLARAAQIVSPSEATLRPSRGGFSLVEIVWHLADLEREGYGVRIRRILAEEEPFLSNFDGERIAHERSYQAKSLEEGLEAFSTSRRRNLEKMREMSSSDWGRPGRQDGIGMIRLEDVPRMMAEHDRSHTEEIRDLFGELRSGSPVARAHPTSAVA